ncbi:MAG TPA: dienelactone hydrolase family protein [Fimbriimonadaceae bacterium]|jgi:carboxymethylenebutenolidase
MTETGVRTEWVDLPVSDGTEMRAYVAYPEGAPHAGLLIFQEAFGVNHHIRNVAERYAAKGFLAIAPELFHRTGPGFEGDYTNFEPVRAHMMALTTEGTTADLGATFDWLKGQNPGSIGAIGYCMGGRVAFLAGLTLPIQCAVSYYGGGIAPNPMGAGYLDRVNDLNCPVLMFWGGLDSHIGSEAYGAIDAALKEAGKDYINVVISKADHGFACDERASYNAEATEEALALTMAFFGVHLDD